MLFSRKLTQDADHNEMEFLLSQLIIQWFDRRFNWQNSLVRQLLNVFFKSFVLFSQQRCELMLRALAKVVYSILESKYGNAKGKRQSGSSRSSSGEKKDGKKGLNLSTQSIPINQKKNKRIAKRDDSDSDDDNDDDYDAKQENSFISDDSRCALNQATLDSICAELDPLQITKVFLLLLSKDYVNANAAKEFALTKDLPLEFLLTIAYANATRLKKVAIVKDYLALLVDHVSLADCHDIGQLKLAHYYIEQNSKMLIQGHPKLKKFLESLDRTISVLQKEEQDIVNDLQESGASEQERQEILSSFLDKLQVYYDDEVFGTVIDLVQDNDEDIYQQQLHGLQIAGLQKILASPLYQQSLKSLKDGNGSPNGSNSGTMSLRRRRSGLRSNKKRLMNTANEGQRLRSIPEEDYAHTGTLRDLSSSEKPPKVHAKLLNDTILEERESPLNKGDLTIDEGNFDDENAISQDGRRGLMSKISKRMARDFAENKKKSIQTSQASILSQQQPPQDTQQQIQQRMKEEYLDRTVYKITKGRSPHKGAAGSYQHSVQQIDQLQELYLQEEIMGQTKPNNLSFQFDQIDDSLASIAAKEKNNISYEQTSKFQKPQRSKHQAASQFKGIEGQKNQAGSNPFKQAPPFNQLVPNRITRSQMKSISSSNQSKAEKSSSSSSDDDDESGEDAFDFMRSKLSKENRKAMKAVAANKNNNVRQPLQSMGRDDVNAATALSTNPFKKGGPLNSNFNNSLISEGTKKPPTRSALRRAAAASNETSRESALNSQTQERMATRGSFFQR